MLIGIALVTTTAIGSIALYKSYAIYKEEKNYNVIQGIIPDFDYDVKVAYTIDNDDTEQNPIPKREEKGKEDKYYSVQVTCNGSDDEPIPATWDYNAWQLKIDNITSQTKCKLAFNSNMSDEERKDAIEAGVAYRRNTYRGKDLTASFNDDKQKFYDSIKNGTFDDIYVGDYITSTVPSAFDSKQITWLIADIDNYLHTGGTPLKNHHVTIIPAKPLKVAPMSKTATTSGGYAGSDMVNTDTIDKTGLGKDENTLKAIYQQYINCGGCTFENYVLKYENALTNTINDNYTNRFGGQEQGASSYWNWYTRKLDLMSEMNVYGGIVWSSAGWDTGIDNRQYAIFRLKPELINSYEDTTFSYWLKDVASKTRFTEVNYQGLSLDIAANTNNGVRPRFLVGGESQSN